MIGRFLVFAFNSHYPGGGWADFMGAHDDLESAVSALTPLRTPSGHGDYYDHGEIIDLATGDDVTPSGLG